MYDNFAVDTGDLSSVGVCGGISNFDGGSDISNLLVVGI